MVRSSSVFALQLFLLSVAVSFAGAQLTLEEFVADLIAVESRRTSYRYGYSVTPEWNDEHGGGKFSHSQHVEEGRTTGEYRILLPDNRWQIVSYVADDDGYRATVRYENLNEPGAPEEVMEHHWGYSPHQSKTTVTVASAYSTKKPVVHQGEPDHKVMENPLFYGPKPYSAELPSSTESTPPRTSTEYDPVIYNPQVQHPFFEPSHTTPPNIKPLYPVTRPPIYEPAQSRPNPEHASKYPGEEAKKAHTGYPSERVRPYHQKRPEPPIHSPAAEKVPQPLFADYEKALEYIQPNYHKDAKPRYPQVYFKAQKPHTGYPGAESHSPLQAPVKASVQPVPPSARPSEYRNDENEKKLYTVDSKHSPTPSRPAISYPPEEPVGGEHYAEGAKPHTGYPGGIHPPHARPSPAHAEPFYLEEAKPPYRSHAGKVEQYSPQPNYYLVNRPVINQEANVHAVTYPKSVPIEDRRPPPGYLPNPVPPPETLALQATPARRPDAYNEERKPHTGYPEMEGKTAPRPPHRPAAYAVEGLKPQLGYSEVGSIKPLTVHLDAALAEKKPHTGYPDKPAPRPKPLHLSEHAHPHGPVQIHPTEDIKIKEIVTTTAATPPAPVKPTEKRPLNYKPISRAPKHFDMSGKKTDESENRQPDVPPILKSSNDLAQKPIKDEIPLLGRFNKNKKTIGDLFGQRINPLRRSKDPHEPGVERAPEEIIDPVNIAPVAEDAVIPRTRKRTKPTSQPMAFKHVAVLNEEEPPAIVAQFDLSSVHFEEELTAPLLTTRSRPSKIREDSKLADLVAQVLMSTTTLPSVTQRATTATPATTATTPATTTSTTSVPPPAALRSTTATTTTWASTIPTTLTETTTAANAELETVTAPLLFATSPANDTASALQTTTPIPVTLETSTGAERTPIRAPKLKASKRPNNTELAKVQPPQPKKMKAASDSPSTTTSATTKASTKAAKTEDTAEKASKIRFPPKIRFVQERIARHQPTDEDGSEEVEKESETK